MKSNRDINLYNGGNFYRDIVHVEDAVDGIKFVMDKGRTGQIYNLGSGNKPVLFKDVIYFIKDKLNSTSNIGSMEPTDFHKIVQVESMYLEVSKLTHLGFRPSRDVFQTVSDIL